jgi:NAD(P)-dependent dehydrogenase (short-subunit alcohol dehydrogenase family)
VESTIQPTLPFSAAGRTALVTGAGRGLGRAIATALAAAGAEVVCAYSTDADAANEVAEEIRSNGGRASTIHVNVADLATIVKAANSLAKAGQTIDILVNNAAIRPRGSIANVTVDEWDAVMAVNLRGPFFLSQALLPGMLAQRWGRIINITGLDAYRGGTNRAHVSASKIGLAGLTRALAHETAEHGVTVNAIVPGLMDTNRADWSDHVAALLEAGLASIPVGRLGDPREVGYACVYLASAEAGYITGQELFVSGGAHPLVRQKLEGRSPQTGVVS